MRSWFSCIVLFVLETIVETAAPHRGTAKLSYHVVFQAILVLQLYAFKSTRGSGACRCVRHTGIYMYMYSVPPFRKWTRPGSASIKRLVYDKGSRSRGVKVCGDTAVPVRAAVCQLNMCSSLLS